MRYITEKIGIDLSIFNLTKGRIIKAIISTVALIVLMGILNSIVKQVSSPLKPNAERGIIGTPVKFEVANNKGVL